MQHSLAGGWCLSELHGCLRIGRTKKRCLVIVSGRKKVEGIYLASSNLFSVSHWYGCPKEVNSVMPQVSSCIPFSSHLGSQIKCAMLQYFISPDGQEKQETQGMQLFSMVAQRQWGEGPWLLPVMDDQPQVADTYAPKWTGNYNGSQARTSSRGLKVNGTTNGKIQGPRPTPSKIQRNMVSSRTPKHEQVEEHHQLLNMHCSAYLCQGRREQGGI